MKQRSQVSHQVSIDGLQSSVRPSEVKNPGPSDGLRPRSSFTLGKYKYWNDNFENYAAFGLAPSLNDELDYVFHIMNLSSFES